MADPIPNWEDFPCLDDVITKADVDTKGTGSYAADYVNWCKTSQLLRTYAKGWQFELRQTLDPNGNDTDVFRAPNGTGYIKGFFRAPTGSGFLDTPDFPQAIMNNRNQPVQWDQITARDVTDTHRRCMCTAAAAHFGLAWQLWAKVEVENPMRAMAEEPQAAPARQRSAKPKANTPPKAEAVAKPEGPSVKDKVDTVLRPLFADAGKDIFQLWTQAFKANFKLQADPSQINGKNIKTEEHFAFTENFINEQLKRKAS